MKTINKIIYITSVLFVHCVFAQSPAMDSRNPALKPDENLFGDANNGVRMAVLLDKNYLAVNPSTKFIRYDVYLENASQKDIYYIDTGIYRGLCFFRVGNNSKESISELYRLDSIGRRILNKIPPGGFFSFTIGIDLDTVIKLNGMDSIVSALEIHLYCDKQKPSSSVFTIYSKPLDVDKDLYEKILKNRKS